MNQAKYILTSLFLALFLGAAAQKPLVTAKLSPDSIGIGDRFTIEINVDKDLTQVVGFPEFDASGTPDKMELVSQSDVDTVSRDGRRLIISKSYTMTTFDEGNYLLGKMGVLYLDKNITDTLYSAESLNLRVTTFPIDTLTQKIYDIKAPKETPVVFAEYSWYLFIGLFLSQILFAIGYIIVKILHNRRLKVKIPKVKLEPPHVIAIRELEKLQEQKLWQNSRPKLYYTRLTDIIREYIEERYGINAMEMTSDEISEALNEIISNKRSATQLRRLLSTSDYVKFAKYIPSVEDNEMSYNDAFYFVEETKVEIVPENDDTKGDTL